MYNSFTTDGNRNGAMVWGQKQQHETKTTTTNLRNRKEDSKGNDVMVRGFKQQWWKKDNDTNLRNQNDNINIDNKTVQGPTILYTESYPEYLVLSSSCQR